LAASKALSVVNFNVQTPDHVLVGLWIYVDNVQSMVGQICNAHSGCGRLAPVSSIIGVKKVSEQQQDCKTLTVPQAGRQYFGLSRSGSYLAAAKGYIPTIKFGQRLRVPVRAMERLMESAEVAP
jgi:hypothetical protein